VTLKNFGTSTLDSVKINWKVNNVAQPVYNWTGSLTGGNTANVVIGNYNFLTSTMYDIVAATSNPNGVADLVTSNDTLMKDSIYVKTGPTLTPALVTLNSCVGDTIILGGTLTGTAPWNIDLYDGSTTVNYNNNSIPSYVINTVPTSNTTYTISVTDSTGCTYYGAANIDVTVNPLPPALITTSSATTICHGDTAILEANTGLNYTYVWDNNGMPIVGATNNIYYAMGTGDYSAIINDSNGCKATSNTIQVTMYSLIAINLGNDTSIGMAFNKVLDAGAGYLSYLWSTGDTIQSITVDTTGVGLGLTPYWVHVTDSTCLGGDTIDITWTTNPEFIEITNNSLKIYPNPTKDKLFISTNGKIANPIIQVFDTRGKLMFSKNINSNNSEIDVSQWSKGIYFVKFYSDSNIIIKKVIVQ